MSPRNYAIWAAPAVVRAKLLEWQAQKLGAHLGPPHNKV